MAALLEQRWCLQVSTPDFFPMEPLDRLRRIAAAAVFDITPVTCEFLQQTTTNLSFTTISKYE
eukprot:CAMPEP_0194067324 /NCGR_PEP_ID=MMETSP0009_2-20130614/86497_1 /TAXON_ID=210454 /ORGANISM="Grammatophora oceanica, Strain CCMP 410" /LENGTH=62 /DNA_ID=CAMNT_0038720339 /DNA_START=746 /DNA_END=934 /DNA_ORIENTATION=-